MGAIADVTSEFKSAGKPEKVMIVVGVIAVAGVAYYIYKYKQATGSQQGVQAGQPGGSQVAGYPMAGNTPVIPGGVNPLYDPAGNLIAFQNPLVNTGLIPGQPVPQPAPSPTPGNWYTNILGSLGYGTKIRAGGSDANGERFWIGQTGNAANQLFYAPTGSKINYGAQGRVWITPPGGTQQLLTGPGQV